MEVPLGRWWQRGLAILMAGCTAWLYLQWTYGRLPGLLVAASCLLLFLLLLLSFPTLYRRWMAFAERLSVWIVRTIFALIYLFFMPFLLFFRTKDRLELKRKDDEQSLWRKHALNVDSLEDMQRLG